MYAYFLVDAILMNCDDGFILLFLLALVYIL
jgi:hypothetical protein